MKKSGGIGIVGILTVVFIVLKLCGLISWSWIWVLSPIWISASLSIAILIIVTVVSAIILAIHRWYLKRLSGK